MWYTPEGLRTLEGAEAELFRVGAMALARRVDRYRSHGYFGRLSADERLIALAAAAKGLLESAEPYTGRSAWVEAAIYAVYCVLRKAVCRSQQLQALVRAACRARDIGRARAEPGELDPLGAEVDVQCLSDLVLWDRAWETDCALHPPAPGDDYFAEPPDASAERVADATAYLQALAIRRTWQRRAG
jgi:hypothetical protein